MRNKNQSGFTLIELLVVIAIIGLLASVVLLALNSARAKARDAKRLADIRQVASAMELYFNDVNSYPTHAVGALSTITGASLGFPAIAPKYIGLLPTEPKPQDGTCSGSGGQNSNQYYWAYDNSGSNLTGVYTITFCLGGDTGGYSAGPHTLTQAGIQ